MSIPLAIFLYIYLFALAVFTLGSIFALYHMLRFGFAGKVPVTGSGIYIGVSFLILMISIFYILKIDWTLSIDLFGELF